MEFQSTNPSFCVSWLLGLQPYQHIPTSPPWAKQYETDDPNFSVSCILGLVPSKKSRRSRKKRRTRRAVRQSAKKSEEQENDSIDPLGLRRLFDELSDEEIEAEEAENSPASSDGEPEVLAESGFLELCSKMENLLDEIEYVVAAFTFHPSHGVANWCTTGHLDKKTTIRTTTLSMA